MFADHAATFVADFGEAVSWVPSGGGATVTGTMIFDMPTQDLASGEVLSREYLVTFEVVAWPGIKRGEQLVIGGAGKGGTYKLRHDPKVDGDGVFASAALTRVT